MTVGPTALHRCKAQIVEARKRLSSSANWDNWGDGETSRIEIWLSSMDVDGKSWEIPRIKDRLGVNFSCTRVLKILLGDKQHPSDVPVDWRFWCFFSRFPHPCRIFQTPLHLLMGQWWTISTSNWGIWGQRLPISNLECARFFIGLEAQSTHSCDFANSINSQLRRQPRRPHDYCPWTAQDSGKCGEIRCSLNRAQALKSW